MKIIVVIGDSNTGKTTVIRDVFRTISGGVMPAPRGKNDYQDKISYKGRVVAISSAGDTRALVKNSFTYARGIKCDVLIMALSSHIRQWGYRAWQRWFHENCPLGSADIVYWVSSNFPDAYTPPPSSPPPTPSWGATPTVNDLTDLLHKYIVDLLDMI